MKGRTFDGEVALNTAIGPSSSEAINDDPILEPKHKIFLSHSGAQKEFVDHLCKALEERCHYPFFDRRPESLPKGKEFPDLIFKAVQQCQLFVVVISEEYFMSKWPMIELNAFVKATKEMKSSMNRGILPLFYGLSVSEWKDERRQRWFEKWDTFARDDPRGLIKVDDWKCALDELKKFNGLAYGRELKQVVEYENEIVSHICKFVTPDIKWEDSHVQGNAHKVVIEKMNQVGASYLTKVKVVGLFGVGGIGKTTTCKTLCNELSNDFEGRVCHIELDNTSSNSKELLQKVVIQLTRKSLAVVQQLGEGECKDILYKNLMKQKSFLAIDNVWDNANSSKQALVFLKAPFHPDSLVLVTARAQKTFEHLGIDGGACLEMPELGQGDATNLFLHYAANGQQFTSEEDMHFIDLCVKRCYFSKGDGGGFHYHPLALESLGRQLGCRGKNPFEWKQVLSGVWSSGKNEVFDVLRSSFDLLRPIEQALFMDVGFFLQHFDFLSSFEFYSSFEVPSSFDYPSSCDPDWIGWLERLCAVHKQNLKQMQKLLDSLKGKGLLQDAKLSLGRISMHDLYSEFVVLEAKGKLIEAPSIEGRRWVYVDGCDGDLSQLEVTPVGGCWQNLTRLSISQDDQYDDQDDQPIAYPIESLAGIEWKHFPNVLVLQLYGLNTVKGPLNLKAIKCLRSLQVHGLKCIERLEGLEELMNLTLFEWTTSSIIGASSIHEVIMGKFPRSLKYLDIHINRVMSGSDVLAQCDNLCKLTLIYVEVGVELDLSNCSSLERVLLSDIDNLKTLLVPRMASRLQSLHVGDCSDLVDIQGLDQLIWLKHLRLIGCILKEVHNLLSLTKLQTLIVVGGRNSIELHIPCQLEKFSHTWGGLIKAPNLCGFNLLQVLDLSSSIFMTCMSEMGDLLALRSLNLSNCPYLLRLPDLSKSRNLEELDLDGCDTLKLYDEDIQTLATLPSLHPVHFSYVYDLGKIKLDLSRRKVLQYVGSARCPPKSWLNWMEGEWQEKDLGRPPIKLSDCAYWGLFQGVSLLEDGEFDL